MEPPQITKDPGRAAHIRSEGLAGARENRRSARDAGAAAVTAAVGRAPLARDLGRSAGRPRREHAVVARERRGRAGEPGRRRAARAVADRRAGGRGRPPVVHAHPNGRT